MARSAILAVLVLLRWTSLTAAAYVPISDLFSRDNSNCASSFQYCGASLPSDFCCPSSTTCIGLDNSSSVICCPSGDCAFIMPITCDIQAQNATANPQATIKTGRLTDKLPTCGNACCPFGYSCQGNSTCALDKSTSSASSSPLPSGTTTIAISTATAGATHTSSPAPFPAETTSPSLASNSTQAQISQSCPGFPGKAVAAGFFPGLIAGALATAIVGMCMRRRQQQEQRLVHHRSSGGTIIGISDPIPADEQSSFRTDFLLRKNSSRFPASTRSKSMLRRTGTRVKSLFGSNQNSTSPRFDNPTPPPMPVTPPRQVHPRRKPSMESIKVYSPASMLATHNLLRPILPHIRDDRPNTTFSDVMTKAGFQNSKGEPYYRLTETPQPQRRT